MRMRVPRIARVAGLATVAQEKSWRGINVHSNPLHLPLRNSIVVYVGSIYLRTVQVFLLDNP